MRFGSESGNACLHSGVAYRGGGVGVGMVCGGELVAVGVRDVVFELRGRRKGLFAGLV